MVSDQIVILRVGENRWRKSGGRLAGRFPARSVARGIISLDRDENGIRVLSLALEAAEVFGGSEKLGILRAAGARSAGKERQEPAGGVPRQYL